jgi:hypothetical protein
VEGVTPTRRPLLSRLKARFQCWRLRLLLSAAEQDHEYHQAMLDQLPRRITEEAKQIAALRIELIQLEDNT